MDPVLLPAGLNDTVKLSSLGLEVVPLLLHCVVAFSAVILHGGNTEHAAGEVTVSVRVQDGLAPSVMVTVRLVPIGN